MNQAEAMERVAEAIENTLISPNETDRNFESANVVDGLYAIARAIRQLADVIDIAADVHNRGDGEKP